MLRVKGCGCFEVVVDVEGFATTTSWMLEVGFFSDVINFRLEQAIIPRCFRFRSSSLRRVYVDYYFYVVGVWLCGC